MGVVFRQSIKSTLVIFMGAFLGAIITWLGTNYIGEQELGFSRNLTNYTIAASQIALMGLHITLSVYVHKYNDNKEKRGAFLASCLIVPLLIIAFLSIFFFAFKTSIIQYFQPQDIPLFVKYFAWLPLFIFLMMYQIILEQYLVSQNLVALSFFVREVLLRLGNIAIILLYGFNFISFGTFIAATVLMYIIPVVINFVLSLRTKAFTLNLNFKAFERSEVVDIVKFTWYHSLLSASIILMGSLDAIMLVPLSKNGVASLAAYSIAAFFISVLQMPYKAMSYATFPLLARAYKDDDMVKVGDIFHRSSLNMLIGAAAMAILIFCNIDSAIALMPKGYQVVKPLFAILQIGVFIDMATGMNTHILSVSAYYRFNFYVSMILVVLLVVLNILLIPSFGVYGAAWSNAIALILFNFIKLIFVWKKMKLQPFSRKTLLILASGLPALAAGYYLPHFFDTTHHLYTRIFLDVAIRSSIIVSIYVLMLLWLKPSNDLQEYVASIKKNRRLF